MEEIVVKDNVWSYIAQETLREHYGLREQSRYYGRIIADEVVRGSLSVEDLASCMAWAGKLARETTEADSETHHEETLARRLLHSSTATALKAVGTDGRRVVHRADYKRRCQLLTGASNSGLFRLEARDLDLNGLDDLLEQVKLRKGKI